MKELTKISKPDGNGSWLKDEQEEISRIEVRSKKLLQKWIISIRGKPDKHEKSTRRDKSMRVTAGTKYDRRKSLHILHSSFFHPPTTASFNPTFYDPCHPRRKGKVESEESRKRTWEMAQSPSPRAFTVTVPETPTTTKKAKPLWDDKLFKAPTVSYCGNIVNYSDYTVS